MPTEKLIFFGTSDFSVPSLRRLIGEKYDLAAVITKPDAPAGRKRIMTPPAVKVLAQEAGIKALQPKQLKEAVNEIKELSPTAGVVVSYGKIIPKEVLDLFPKGLINIHASLLPNYRGASPIEAAILNGDEKTGVSLMLLDEGMDTGPVYIEKELELSGTETKPELFEKLAHLGADLLVDSLTDILSGMLIPVPQNDNEATGVKIIQKNDGEIDWNSSATWIARQIRAYLGWPGSHTLLYNQDVIVTAAQALPSSVAGKNLHPGEVLLSDAGDLFVGCAEDVLLIERLKPAGKTEMSAQDFLRGRK